MIDYFYTFILHGNGVDRHLIISLAPISDTCPGIRPVQCQWPVFTCDHWHCPILELCIMFITKYPVLFLHSVYVVQSVSKLYDFPSVCPSVSYKDQHQSVSNLPFIIFRLSVRLSVIKTRISMSAISSSMIFRLSVSDFFAPPFVNAQNKIFGPQFQAKINCVQNAFYFISCFIKKKEDFINVELNQKVKYCNKTDNHELNQPSHSIFLG